MIDKFSYETNAQHNRSLGMDKSKAREEQE